MRARFIIGILAFFLSSLLAQTWQIPHTSRHIQMDGRLDDWEGIPVVVLEPGTPGVRTEGDFGEDDLRVAVQAAWTQEGLHLAVRWQDDAWDVEDIPRRDAVWISPDGRRRNRMLFYDNLHFFLNRRNFSYLAWISPRAGGRGPFSWSKMFGEKGLEQASSPPLISTYVEDDGTVNMEWLFRWKDLRIKPKQYKDLRFQVEIADSDRPGLSPEGKAVSLKSLQWTGAMLIGKKGR